MKLQNLFFAIFYLNKRHLGQISLHLQGNCGTERQQQHSVGSEELPTEDG